MKCAVVYSSVTGNTGKLAEAIKTRVDACYFGKPSDEALEADLIFVGFWAIGNSCGTDIKDFLEKLSDKKVFIFGTVGYNNTQEYYEGILDNVKANVPSSNTIVGTYVCQGKVSAPKKEQIKEKMPEKYEAMKDKIAEGENHPDEQDISGLVSAIGNLMA